MSAAIEFLRDAALVSAVGGWLALATFLAYKTFDGSRWYIFATILVLILGYTTEVFFLTHTLKAMSNC